MSKIRIGLQGFGEIPRHIYRLCLNDDRFEVVAISEIGRPEILHYLCVAETKGAIDVKLDGNFLVSEKGKTRFVRGVEPGDVPWDMFDVDLVIDATGKFKRKAHMENHYKAGAPRVMLSTLPEDDIDRIVIMGVNEHTIKSSDKFVSAGSATTNAAAILLKILDEAFGIDYAMLTTVHSYTSDQPLRDKVSNDFRRSRSAAENIIPNWTPSPYWLQKIMPEFYGRIEGTALNVPVPNGSLLDLNTVFKDEGVSIDDVHKAIEKAAKGLSSILQVTDDPIVSTDVINNTHSLVFDKKATMKSPGRMIKTLTWYHTALAMAARMLDVVAAYNSLEKKGGRK